MISLVRHRRMDAFGCIELVTEDHPVLAHSGSEDHPVLAHCGSEDHPVLAHCGSEDHPVL